MPYTLALSLSPSHLQLTPTRTTGDAIMRKSLEEFLTFARTDAAVQERVAGVLRGTDASKGVVEVARSLGWLLDENSVRAELTGALGEHELEGVVGGLGAPAEWFAEQVVAPKPTIKGPG
jgi:hypothetical protein